MDTYKDIPTLEKHLLDIASVGTVIGTMTSHLPSVAALLTILWTGIRVWETDTIRALTGRSVIEKKIVIEKKGNGEDG